MTQGPEREKDEVFKTLTQGRRFMEEILRENERLRYKILHLEQEAIKSGGMGVPRGNLAEENKALREQLDTISSRFSTLAKESEDFLQRYRDMERQNENLLNLYVSGFQLHSSIRQEDVLAVISEILLNLVGADVFTLWLVNQSHGRLEVASLNDEDGVLGKEAPPLAHGILKEVGEGRNWEPETAEAGQPLMAIPLQIESRTVGVLAIYRLLTQKEGGISALDKDLLGLLAAQSGVALLGSRLFGQLKQELKTL